MTRRHEHKSTESAEPVVTSIRDGNKEIENELPKIVEIIARTARWVHPRTFHELPVWCPYIARGDRMYDATWTNQYNNKHRGTGESRGKIEANISAGNALVATLGVVGAKPKNWTVCHIWGYDDPKFSKDGSVVRDPRFYSCIGNMVWIPTPLKGFTDAVPQIKTMLRTCAFYLYDWACEHESVKEQARRIRAGAIPEGYPKSWPSPDRKGILPPGTAQFTPDVQSRVARQKAKIKTMLAHKNLPSFPRERVHEVLKFWNVKL